MKEPHAEGRASCGDIELCARIILAEAAEEACAMNVEKARLAGNQHQSGLIPASKKVEADAEAKASEADLLAARLGLDLTRAELDRLLGGGQNL